MPTNFVYILPDDPRLNKHISCITGIFQIFDQQQDVITRKQRSEFRTRSNSSDSLPSNVEDFRFGLPNYNDYQVVSAFGRHSPDYSLKARGSRASSKSKERRRSSSVADHRTRSEQEDGYGDFDNQSNQTSPISLYSQDQPRIWYAGCDGKDSARNSPSILHSSKSTVTFREPPRSSLDSSAAFRGASYVSTKHERRACLDNRDARRSPLHLTENTDPHFMNSFDPPRASLDGRGTFHDSINFQDKFELPRHSIDGRENSTTTLEDLRESIRKIAKRQESFTDDYEAPRPSPDVTLYANTSPFSDDSLDFYNDGKEPPRASCFDYKEAMRFTQTFREEPRLSFDSRATPKSVLEMRHAIQAHLDGLEIPSRCSTPDMKRSSKSFDSASQSTTTSNKEPLSTSRRRRVPSVIARLMGLENLPDAVIAAKPQSIQPKKPSKEAKLLQGLLQCKPFEASRQHEAAIEKKGSFEADSSTLQIRGLSESRQKSTSGTNILTEAERKQQASKHTNEPATSGTNIGLMKTVEEMKSNQDIAVNGLNGVNFFQDEIEKKLRQLGLQSSEHERKTLKQILEAMHLKGLFRDPQLKQTPKLKVEPNSSVAKQESLKVSSIDMPKIDSTPKLHEAPKADSSKQIDLRDSATKSKSLITVKTQESTITDQYVTQSSIVIMKPLPKAAGNSTTPLSSHLTRGDVENMCVPNPALTNREAVTIKEKSRSNGGVKSKSDNSKPVSAASPRQLGERQSREALISPKARRDKGSTEMAKNTRSNQLSKTKQKDTNVKKQRSQSAADTPLRSAPSGRRIHSQKQPVKEETGSLKSSMSSPDQKSVSPISKGREGMIPDSIYECPKSSKDLGIELTHNNESKKPIFPKLETERETLFINPLPGRGSAEAKQFRVDHAKSIKSMGGEIESQNGGSKTFCQDGKEQFLCNGNKSPSDCIATEAYAEVEQDKSLLHGGGRVDELDQENLGVPSPDQELKVAVMKKFVFVGDIDSKEQTQSSPISVLDVPHCDMCECSPDHSTGDLNKLEQRHHLGEILELTMPSIKQNSNRSLDIELDPDFKYVQQILMSASMEAMTHRWFLHGNPMDVDGIYSKLEEKNNDDKLSKMDRDFGGELYRKSRQQSMGRRLLLDCVNEILCRKLRGHGVLVFQGKREFRWGRRIRRWERKGMVEEVWEELQRLSCIQSRKAATASTVEDDMYRILESDLGAWEDEGEGDGWCCELGEMILVDLVEELLLQHFHFM